MLYTIALACAPCSQSQNGMNCVHDVFSRRGLDKGTIILESIEVILQGVRSLLNWGCLPVLSAFVPAPGTDGATLPAPGVEWLLELQSGPMRLSARSVANWGRFVGLVRITVSLGKRILSLYRDGLTTKNRWTASTSTHLGSLCSDHSSDHNKRFPD